MILRWGALTSKLEQLASEGVSDKVLTTVIEEALTDILRLGTPATFTVEQIVQIVAVACENPAEAGRPISQWTPREVADEVIQRGIVETISTRSVGRFLQSGGFSASSGGVLAQRPARWTPQSLPTKELLCVLSPSTHQPSTSVASRTGESAQPGAGAAVVRRPMITGDRTGGKNR